jgi:glucose-1-phosphate cytidylyltransferase
VKVIILAGGKGTRLAEETGRRPKPMVEIGGKPILWHIMNVYAHYGHREFLIASGYMGEHIKEYFHNFYLHNNDYIVNLSDGSKELLNSGPIDWRVGVVDTGADTMTGGRIKRLAPWLGDEPFMATYGDGVGNVNVGALLAFHRSHGKLATVTAVRPNSRFGALQIDDGQVSSFMEKPQTEAGWINGGFFVFEPGVLDYIDGDDVSLERGPMERLAAEGQLCAYKHRDFWQPMDTLREKKLLESMWQAGTAPWRVWE